MKNKVKIAFLSVFAAFTAGAAVTASLSWFAADTTLPSVDILGFSDGAYFAYGTGTQGDPYGIKTPKQLSNLAWLQYAGFFEKTNYLNKEDTDGILDTVYFELANDIDCTGWNIPPIGTEEHPFLGEFNGNGYTISNLTISNADSFTSKPRGIEYETHPTVVGLFGVIGEYTDENGVSAPEGTYETSTNQVVNTGIENLTVYSTTATTLAGVVAGYANGTMRNVAVNHSKLYISASGVKSLSNRSAISEYSLVGYCTEEFRGTVSTYSTSMYGLEVAKKEFVAAEQNEDSEIGWGGSINMADMYTRLDNIWDQFKNTAANGTIDAIKYPTEKHTITHLDSTTETTYANYQTNSLNGTENNTFSSGSGNHSYFAYEYNDATETDTSKDQTASFAYVVQTSGTGWSASNEERFMCLTGRKTVTTTTRMTNYTDTEFSYSGAICDGDGHYLASTSNGNISVVTTYNSSTCSWTIDSNGYLKNDNRNTYLYCYGANTVRAANSSSNYTYYKWTYDSTNNCLYSVRDGTTYGMYYYNNNFRTQSIDVAAVNGYTLYGNGYYLVANISAGTVTTTSSADSATKWLMNGNYFYVEDNGTRYYLYQDSTNGARLYNGNTSNTCYIINGGKLRSGGYGSRRYLVISNTGALSITSTQNSGTNITSTSSVITPAHTDYTLTHIYRSGTGTTSTSTQGNYATFETPHTYFPLVDGDTVGVPSEKNTGYVVSGGNYYGDPYGDIRVSEYYFSDLSGDGGSSGNRTLDTVYTINMDGSYSTIEYENNSFTRYDKAHDDFIKNALNKYGNNIYGLHFMKAPITYGSGGKSAVAEKAIINGDTFYNYEFPTDCIDFNLKEKGFITFFAGAYYTDNNCFFSLHKIYRNGSSIENVMEIVNILSDGNEDHSYVYLLKDTSTNTTKYYYTKPFVKNPDGSYSTLDGNAYSDTISNLLSSNASGTTNKPTNYTEVFKTSQIKVNSEVASTYSGYAFYFEIPMNDGEYCLGSINESGANGAYLMYLDIGANALKMRRTTFTERFVTTETFHPYVLGVAWVNDVSSSLASVVEQKGNREAQMALNVIDGSDSATMKVFEPGAGNTIGIVQFDRSVGTGDAKDSIAMQITATEKAKAIYIGSNVDLLINNSSVPMGEDEASSERVESEILRLEYWDYNTTTRETTKTIVTDVFKTTINALGQESDFTAERTVEQFILEENATEWKTIEESKWVIYNSETGDAMTIANIKDIECEEEDDSIAIETENNTIVITFEYSNYVTEVTLTIDFDVSLVSGTTFYVSTDSDDYLGPGTFVITLETPDGDVDIEVINAHTFTITINGVSVPRNPS